VARCGAASRLRPGYDIDRTGIVIGESLTAYEGVLTGGACRISDTDLDKTSPKGGRQGDGR
jgi:hypothetical protein